MLHARRCSAKACRRNAPFCDVLIGRDPAGGIIIALPPHTGPVTLTFDLHNRHTYSEELVKTNRGVPPLHRDHRRADGGQHAALAGGRAERVPDRSRPARPHRRRSGPGRRQSGRADRRRNDRRSRSRAEENSVSILGEKLAVIGPDGHRQLHRAGPAHRHHQQRDARVPAGAGAPAPHPRDAGERVAGSCCRSSFPSTTRSAPSAPSSIGCSRSTCPSRARFSSLTTARPTARARCWPSAARRAGLP